MDNKKPASIKVLGNIFIITGILGFVSILWVPDVLKTTPLQILWFAWGLLFIVTGIGILNLKNWARILALVLVTIKAIQVFIGSINDTIILIKIYPESGTKYLGVSISIIVFVIGCGLIYYLLSPKLKEKFK